MGRFECHAHTDYSNIRLLDCINTPKTLVNYAKEIGLKGICITDHECLGSHVELDKMQQELIENNEDFKIGLGNEIYLVDERKSNQRYFHFILIAKDAIGHKMLRELSSIGWINSFYDRGMERVPVLKEELQQIIEKYGKGHLIASSACLGSEIDYCILQMNEAECIGDKQSKKIFFNRIVNFIKFCLSLFGEDFYLEVQPAQSEEQLIVNNRMKAIADYFKIKIIVTTDAHYLKKEDREIHKAYLNSKGGEREVDSFYQYAYLQTTEEVIENLKGTNLDYEELEKNTIEIYNKIERYSFHKNQQVPEVEVTDYPKRKINTGYSTIDSMFNSDNIQERYWVNYCINKLKEIGKLNDTYLSRLEEEADIQKVIGDKLGTCMFAYPIFLQHYINLFWECGSTVGAGRGCFTPEALVTMGDGRTKKISDIVRGEYVLSAKGNIKEVVDTLSYDCDEELYQIVPATDTAKTITCTNNHEFWVMSGGPCGIDRVQCSKNCSRKNCKRKSSFEKHWKKAEDLTEFDYIFYPRPKFNPQSVYRFDLAQYIACHNVYSVSDDTILKKIGQKKSYPRYIEVDKDFMYCLGVMIGDGWTTLTKDKNCIGIAFNSSTTKDQESMNRVVQYFEKLGFSPSIEKSKDRAVNQVYIYSKPLAKLFESLIGKGAENKKIPSELMFDNEELMLSLLMGLLAADGSYDKDSLRFSYDSVNYSLISQIKELCAYLGIYASISTREASKSNKESYKLRAGGPQLNAFIGRLPFKYNKPSNNKTQTNVIVETDGFYFKIKDISKKHYKGKVYDLTVEDDHCYLVYNVGVHNSACSGLNHYLLGITQLDPIEWNLPYWRYLNKERIELGDELFQRLPSE